MNTEWNKVTCVICGRKYSSRFTPGMFGSLCPRLHLKKNSREHCEGSYQTCVESANDYHSTEHEGAR